MGLDNREKVAKLQSPSSLEEAILELIVGRAEL